MSEERGDGGGTEFERVLTALRTRIADGTYALNSQLPPQRELAEEFQVSRDTVQRVMRELNSEGWIKSRQGSGSRVVKRPTHLEKPKQEVPRRAALGTFIARAFAQPVVQLDVFTLTSESLDAHIRLQAERIRLGEIQPERIELRMLLPSESLELPYPRAKRPAGEEGPPREPGQPDRLQERLRAITRRHTTSLRVALYDLRAEGLVPEVEVEIRYVPLAAAFKLYLRPGVEALFGPYEVVERTILLDDGTEVEARDVLGLGSTLTRHVNDEGDPDSPGSVFMESMQAWFNSCWDLLAETP
ncbi:MULTISPECIES: winged helix-turn-helix domain-containing protein [Streptomyces]|uniref:GntR family transcriptional regulator n=1 Tax=Streptomyces dengpaensis TaxID=2049881 RepID=A0ABM6T2P7_9ACTN|nr:MULTISPECIES: winged helix-turn-helix domain-containing protein [Streptomyces]AVH61342.1 GntR family transcriptional regulator [Streptomyces dengpaensis]PIB06598.1 GntR family transcriptional regulator [Streptomyces sp. HG99]